MPNFCAYTEYLFPHYQSRMRKMQSGERIMRISLSALSDSKVADLLHTGQLTNSYFEIVTVE